MPEPATPREIFQLLLKEYGEQHWWPAETPFEMMVGAILTQNTAWTNVEMAIAGLKKTCSMTPEGITSLPIERLEEAIRPSGYFRQKAKRLRTLGFFLTGRYGEVPGSLTEVPTGELRRQFLDLNGIGPETADSILLYAFKRPVFVVDAYTIRLLSRLEMCGEKAKYDEVQTMFMENMEPDVSVFKEYHALIVRHARERCSKREPGCGVCVLREKCTFPDSRFHIPDSR